MTIPAPTESEPSEHERQSQDGAAVDQRHPWLGLTSFSEATRDFFYGREDEVGELARRVQRKLLTVLFGQSGLGKTSILRAGIVPRLRNQGYCPVYVRIDYGPDAPAPARQIKAAVLRETAAVGHWTRVGVAADDESLWEFFHHRDDVLQDAQGKPLIPLLIFDQFEEIFTLAQSDAGGRQRAANFIEDLAELVENRPSQALEARLDEDDSAVARFDFARSDYRVLITLREDYLAHLESLKGPMPSITQNRMRLAPMTGQQALAAVTGPGGRLVSEEVAAAIVRFVAGGAELAQAQVEPSLLSLICRELNDKRIAADRSEITLDLLAGSHASILTDFYARALIDQPEAVRSVIEDVLLTASGYRENVAEERVLQALGAAGAAPDARSVLAILVNRRLLRIEDRLDVRRVELTHDVLCGVVLASRAQRHEREERQIAERTLAEQREREKRTRKALVRARQVMTGCLILTVVAVASTVFGYIKMKQANRTQAMADTSRAGSENLVSYLLDDFYVELEPIGRLDMLGELARRTSSYYQSLPVAMRTLETELNRARALLRLGQVQSGYGKLAEADKTLGLAEATIAPLTAADKTNEATQLSLANILYERGVIAYFNGDRASATKRYARAIAVATPFALVPHASAEARLVYAKTRTRVGFVKLRSGDMPGAQIELYAARGVIDDAAERKADPILMIAYLKAGQWLHETLAEGVNRDYAGAEVVAKNTIFEAQTLLQTRPNYQPAMRLIEAVSGTRGIYAVAQRKDTLALEMLTDSIAQVRELLRFDASNANGTVDFSINLGFLAYALAGLGRPIEAKHATDQIWAFYASAPPSIYHANNLSHYAMIMESIYAESGEKSELEKMTKRRHLYQQMASQGQDAAAREETLFAQDIIDFLFATVAGDPGATVAALASLQKRGEQLLARSGDPEARQRLGEDLRIADHAAGLLLYGSPDYARAERASQNALASLLAHEDLYPPLAFAFGLTVESTRADHALALARLHRLTEARTEIALALAAQRAQIADGADDKRLQLDLAKSLFVSALCQPTAGQPELAEASALIRQLPASMQTYRSVRLWRTRINDEIRRNTRALAGAAPAQRSMP